MRGVDDPSPASGPDGRRDRWSEHRRARREALVDTALGVIRRLGPDWGMGDMARAAGVSKPVLYRYFRDKTELDDAVCERGMDLLRRRLPSPDELADAPAPEWLFQLAHAYLAVVEEHTQLYRCLVHVEAGGAPPAVGSRRTTVIEVVRELVRRRMAGDGDGGGGGPLDLWSHAVAGLVLAAGDWWLEHGGPSREWAARQVSLLAGPAVAATRDHDGSAPASSP
ncbi:TetR/AcrR family transcriptional regulator [Streptoalloteichus hindustanus]|uniref:Transcriptional regulator, TetR family n=1 Tax=Streptoalloteichus hindustanus TaxID=2017 RepID=A0A1M5PRY5_STRHI|nr:TetR/AcrR family transcriptional regulator [Streptoalloteichus hindustanus]SHH04336.1 transcriptional regulator, TetR family [Streptoalloteichus hindustanus]